jgi:hypothetical protein
MTKTISLAKILVRAAVILITLGLLPLEVVANNVILLTCNSRQNDPP